jgi:glycerol-3-phosphate dehydrogenase
MLLNYAEAQHFIHNEQGQITGVSALEKIKGQQLNIRARAVVNACGPWVDLLRKEDKSLQGKRLQLTKGVHLVFPYHKLPVKQAAYFDVKDGRMIFAIPRNNITYVGTTDTIYNQDLNNPQCTKDDAQYLLDAVNNMFPSVNLQMQDIISSWAGLRPLIYEEGKSASELSRKDEIMVSDSGLISIAGGKLTGYRLMAEKIVDLVAKRLNKNCGRCKTKNFRISGGEFKDEVEFNVCLENLIENGLQVDIDASQTKEWFYRYGRNTLQVMKNAGLLRPLIAETDKLMATAELLYAIENEMVYYLNDFMIRRTGKIFFDIENSVKQIDYLANFLSQKLNPENGAFQNNLHAIKEEFQSAVSFL